MVDEETLELNLQFARRNLRRSTKGMSAFLFAGATYWGVLAALGFWFSNTSAWYWAALFGTGALYPLALLFSRLLRTPIHQKSALSGVLVPAFFSMMLFWPIAIAALWTDVELFVLVLAIGLSLHLPVAGWVVRLTPLYILHCIIRAICAFAVWHLRPEELTTLLPGLISSLYFLTAISAYFFSQLKIGAEADA